MDCGGCFPAVMKSSIIVFIFTPSSTNFFHSIQHNQPYLLCRWNLQRFLTFQITSRFHMNLFYLFYVTDTFNSVVGGVYLVYHVLIQKSITWSDFNLNNADSELLQTGLVLLFLQVGRRKTKKQITHRYGRGYLHLTHNTLEGFTALFQS